MQLPQTIVKLAPEPHRPARSASRSTTSEAAEIILEIGLSDTPYYPDPREKSSHLMPAALWEKQALRILLKR